MFLGSEVQRVSKADNLTAIYEPTRVVSATDNPAVFSVF
jgi:hypothetical protein